MGKADKSGQVHDSEVPWRACQVHCLTRRRCNPVGVGGYLGEVTQGSAPRATLGWMIQSRWDRGPPRDGAGSPFGGAVDGVPGSVLEASSMQPRWGWEIFGGRHPG